MAKDNVSPEELLFKAIEKNKDVPAEAGVPKNPTFDIKKLFLDFKSKIPFFEKKKGEANKKTGFNIFSNLKILNRVLTVIVGILVIFLITDMVMSNQNQNKIFAGTVGMGAWQFQKKPIILLKKLSFYEEAASKRDLFNPPEAVAAKSVAGANPQLAELTKDLSLVGIYWGTHPEAMIEDTQAKKTYFLKRGDQINGLKIKNILNDRVILEYRGKEMEFM